MIDRLAAAHGCGFARKFACAVLCVSRSDDPSPELWAAWRAVHLVAGQQAPLLTGVAALAPWIDSRGRFVGAAAWSDLERHAAAWLDLRARTSRAEAYWRGQR